MNIYVGNLSFDTREQDLEGLFSTYGEILNVRLISDRDTGRSRGFGFVEMSNDADGQKAIEGLNGQELLGRQLTINEARPQEQRSGQRRSFR